MPCEMTILRRLEPHLPGVAWTERFRENLATWLFMLVMKPAAFVMTRRMLLGLKLSAEMLQREPMQHGLSTRAVAWGTHRSAR